jgi:hypothetical protein
MFNPSLLFHDPSAEARFSTRTRFFIAAGLVVWCASITAGVAIMADYSTRPGAQSAAPARIEPAVGAADRSRLFLFVHPHCPCSRATVHELAEIIAVARDKVDVTVYLFRPGTEPDAWTNGLLRDKAAAVPGVRVAVDPDGRIAEAFGSNTSGDVLIYAADGRLRFHGGITASRGHEGDNLGKSRALASLQHSAAEFGSAPVFGCSIRAPNGRSSGENSR